MQLTTWQADNTMNKFQHVGTSKYNKVFTTRRCTYLTFRLYYQRIIHKYKCLLPFSFLSSFFKLRGRENMQLQYLAFWRVPSESIFFRFTPVISAAVSKYLITSTTGLKIPVLLLRPEFGTRFAPSVHDDICLQNSISLSLFPPTKKGATSALGFWPII